MMHDLPYLFLDPVLLSPELSDIAGKFHTSVSFYLRPIDGHEVHGDVSHLGHHIYQPGEDCLDFIPVFQNEVADGAVIDFLIGAEIDIRSSISSEE
jgi:hypothetical protein